MILEMTRTEIRGCEEVQQFVEAAVRDSKCLVFFEEGPRLRRRLEELLGQDAILVPLVELAGAQISEGLSGGLRSSVGSDSELLLMFVGHSDATAESEQPTADQSRGYERFVQGAARVERQLQESRERFVSRVELLLEQIYKGGIDSSRKLRVQVVFYQAAGGLFLNYDWKQGEFRSLIGS